MENDKGDGSELLKSRGRSYTEKKDVLENVKSSAYVFFIVGIFGILALILIWFEVIKLTMDFYMQCMSTAIMGTLFLFFIFMGIKSMLRVGVLNQETSLEQSRTKEITKWMQNNYTLEQLDAMLGPESLSIAHLSMEQLFFVRTGKIAELIQEQFGIQEENYLDYLVEKIYQIYSPEE